MAQSKEPIQKPERQRMTLVARRGDSVVMTPDGKYVSVNGEPVDPDTGLPVTRPVDVMAGESDKAA